MCLLGFAQQKMRISVPSMQTSVWAAARMLALHMGTVPIWRLRQYRHETKGAQVPEPVRVLYNFCCLKSISITAKNLRQRRTFPPLPPRVGREKPASRRSPPDVVIFPWFPIPQVVFRQVSQGKCAMMAPGRQDADESPPRWRRLRFCPGQTPEFLPPTPLAVRPESDQTGAGHPLRLRRR